MTKVKLFFSLIAVMGMLFLAACGGGDKDARSKGAESNAGGETYEWDFSHFFPPTSFIEEEVQGFIEEVEEATDGRIKITSYPGASLAAPDEHFDAAATGSVDIALSVHGYTPNQFPLTSVMELPFMSTASIEGSTNLWDLYNEFDEFDDEYAGTVPLLLYTTDPGHIHTTKKPIKSVEDLKGMRIRSPSPEASEWLESLGATPVSMPMNETFEALERGVVDGTVASWEAVKVWGLDEIINYSTIGNFYTTTMFVVMNENLFNELSEEDQNTLKQLAGENMVKNIGEAFDKIGAESLAQAEEKGIEIYELSDAELKEWSKYINPTIENKINSINDKGLPGQEVFDRALELSGN